MLFLLVEGVERSEYKYVHAMALTFLLLKRFACYSFEIGKTN